MKKSSVNFYFYSSVLLINMLAAGWAAYYLQFKGGFDPEFLASVYNVGPSVSSVLENRYYQKAKLSFLHGDMRESNDYFERVKKEIDQAALQMPSVVSVSAIEPSMQAVEQAFTEIMSRPQVQGPLNILIEKLASLESLSRSKRWPTLIAISERSGQRAQQFLERANALTTTGRLEAFVTSLESDFNRAREIVNGSILSGADKKLVETLLNQMNPDLEELSTLHKNTENLKISLDKFDSQVEVWAKENIAAATEKKQGLNNLNRHALEALGILTFFLLIALVAGAIIFRFTQRRQQVQQEQMTLEMIKRGILSQEVFENTDISGFSQKFGQAFLKLRDYTQRRLAFGALVQDGLPFASLLFDTNLRVVWANHIFFEQWNLVGQKDFENTLSWDFLLQYTNLGHEDPIKTALSNNVPGIYQIKVRPKDIEEACTYEMYVTPIEYSGQRKVMVFLYPMKAMEETLNLQLASLTVPINKMLDFLLHSSDNPSAMQALANDFEVSGIAGIYEKFQTIGNYITDQRNGLLSEIEKLENEICDQMKVKTDISKAVAQSVNIQKGAIASFKDAKKNFINLAISRAELEKQTHWLLSNLKILAGDCKIATTALDKYKNGLEHNVTSLKALGPLKDQVKKAKKNVDTNKSDIIQALDHCLLKTKTQDNDRALEEEFSQLKKLVKSIDSSFGEFGAYFTHLEVGLAKLEMTFDESMRELGTLPKMPDRSEAIPGDYEISKMVANIEGNENSLIETLKQIVKSFRDAEKVGEQMQKLIVEKLEEASTQNDSAPEVLEAIQES
ncbi:MAG: hypothetical protein A2X86_17050 [Bdellovibrionales bacterium GWA2_49_15]|nr:MAG: hypothetical protein A2X86_17050 [Bdellovibrionales bacterium GWA2_49_15]HAZ14054.1 hypothetical protein [Bdellovibrionales bacterium]